MKTLIEDKMIHVVHQEYMVSGAWYMASGAWYMASGLAGTWRPGHGAHGTWRLAPPYVDLRELAKSVGIKANIISQVTKK